MTASSLLRLSSSRAPMLPTSTAKASRISVKAGRRSRVIVNMVDSGTLTGLPATVLPDWRRISTKSIMKMRRVHRKNAPRIVVRNLRAT